MLSHLSPSIFQKRYSSQFFHSYDKSPEIILVMLLAFLNGNLCETFEETSLSLHLTLHLSCQVCLKKKKKWLKRHISPHLVCQSGYTFVAEAVTPESPPIGAKWRMRLIGCDLLPKLSHEPPLNAFSAKEFQDYYVTNDRNLICR